MSYRLRQILFEAKKSKEPGNLYYRVAVGEFGKKGKDQEIGSTLSGVFASPHKEAIAQLAQDEIARHQRIHGKDPSEPQVQVIRSSKVGSPKLLRKDSHYGPYDAGEVSIDAGEIIGKGPLSKILKGTSFVGGVIGQTEPNWNDFKKTRWFNKVKQDEKSWSPEFQGKATTPGYSNEGHKREKSTAKAWEAGVDFISRLKAKKRLGVLKPDRIIHMSPRTKPDA